MDIARYRGSCVLSHTIQNYYREQFNIRPLFRAIQQEKSINET